jgi:hypothetical protein
MAGISRLAMAEKVGEIMVDFFPEDKLGTHR